MRDDRSARTVVVLLFVFLAASAAAQTPGNFVKRQARSAPRMLIPRGPLAADFAQRAPLNASAAGLRDLRSWLASHIVHSNASPASVVNASWVGGNGNWGTGTDWTPSGVPNNGANTYNVTIDSNYDDVGLNVAATVTSLTLGGATGSGSELDIVSGHALTITGAFTVGADGYLTLSGAGSNLTTGTLTNNGNISIGSGDTLALTNQASGITDVVAGSTLSVIGTFSSGANNALYKLNSLEGTLNLDNGVTSSVTPGSGTLTISSTGTLFIYNGASAGTTLTVNGNLNNSGYLNASLYSSGGFADAFTVTGSLTNQSSGVMYIGSAYNDSVGSEVVNAGALVNSGQIYFYPFYGAGAGNNLNAAESSGQIA